MEGVRAVMLAAVNLALVVCLAAQPPFTWMDAIAIIAWVVILGVEIDRGTERLR